MSWPLKKKLQKLLADEEGAIVRDPGGALSVALVYPNTYRVGMSNLAVHTLYAQLNHHPQIVCERAFFPERGDIAEHLRTETPVMVMERQRPLGESEVIALSISFENDLLNVLPLLELSGIPHRRELRTHEHPLIIAGGAAVTLNPRAFTAIADVCLPGDFEAYHDDLVKILTSDRSKEEKIAELQAMTSRTNVPERKSVGVQTSIWAKNTEFGSMHLIEVMRGCPVGCAFCAVPGIYGPPRYTPFNDLIAMIDEGFTHRNKFGLIGADILGHPAFLNIAEHILARGGSFSLSSVRLERITPLIAELLARSGMRAVSLGVEAGTERLRRLLKKNFSDERLLEAVADLAHAGITHVRLYFMIGLPLETDEDIEAIPRLAREVRDTLHAHAPRTRRTSSVEITATPFVPKPHTPFAREKFAGIARLNALQKRLKQLLGKNKDVTVSFDTAQQAAIEHYLAHADASTARFFLEEAHRTSSREAIKKIRDD